MQIRPSTVRNCHITVQLRNGKSGGALLNLRVTERFNAGQFRGHDVTFSQQGALQRAVSTTESGTTEAVYHQGGFGAAIDAVALPDGSNAAAGQSAGAVDIPGIAKRAADAVAAAMSTGNFRHLNYPASSAAAVNLCRYVSAASIDQALGIAGPRSSKLSRNDCQWQVDEGDVGPYVDVFVRFELNRKVQQGVSPFGRTSAMIAGRSTSVHASVAREVETDTKTYKWCSYATAGRTWNPWIGYRVFADQPDAPDPTLIEVVDVVVNRPMASNGTSDQLCAAASRIATEVWVHLP